MDLTSWPRSFQSEPEKPVQAMIGNGELGRGGGGGAVHAASQMTSISINTET